VILTLRLFVNSYRDCANPLISFYGEMKKSHFCDVNIILALSEHQLLNT
jgi:glycosylphosphatidylinositol transamidase (GPIT) subunit GPI8